MSIVPLTDIEKKRFVEYILHHQSGNRSILDALVHLPDDKIKATTRDVYTKRIEAMNVVLELLISQHTTEH